MTMQHTVAAQPTAEEEDSDFYFDEPNILDERDYKLCTLLYCVDRLRKRNDVSLKYHICIDTVGDVVFKMDETYNPCRSKQIAIRVKQTNNVNRRIDERYLCWGSGTYLFECFEHFKNAVRSDDQLILWTNMPIDGSIRHWFEDYVHDSSVKNMYYHKKPMIDILGTEYGNEVSYERFRIKEYKRQEIFQKCLKQLRKRSEKDIPRAETEKNTYGPSQVEFEQFLDRLVFYVNVPRLGELKGKLLDMTGSMFYYYYELVESFAFKDGLTWNQIRDLVDLANSHTSIESRPYAKLIFNDLDELKYKVWTWFTSWKTSSHLRVKASMDIDITVSRLITALQYLGFHRKCVLAVDSSTFCNQKATFKSIMSGYELKCTIISSVTDNTISNIKGCVSHLKVIFVGDKLECDFDDQFDINCLDSASKSLIKSKKIKLSQQQCVTAYEIFGDELFQKQNYRTALELYRWPEDSVLQITTDDLPVDGHYLPRRTMIILQNQTDFGKWIIQGEPGTGKTTELIKLCSDFKAKHQDHLVVYLHCAEAVFRWKGCAEDLIRSTVKTCGELSNSLFRKIIKLGKIILLLDGYDEVSQQRNNILRRLVADISRVKMYKLYIATGPKRKQEIVDILGKCGECHLQPFTVEDQLAYLKNVWNIKDDTLVDTNTRSILQSLVIGKFFIGNALQMQMIAEIYKNRILSSNFQLYEQASLGLLYKEFIEYKFMEYVKRNTEDSQPIKSLREAYLHDHAVTANEIFLCSNLAKAESKNVEAYGIIIFKPKVTFIHHTYMEYFLALHLLTFSTEIRQIDFFLNLYLDSAVNSVFYFVDYLLKTINPKTPLHRPTRKPLSDYTPPKTALLHPDKMIEFHTTLYHWDPARVHLLLSRLKSYRLFNLLEVIYDSLRVEIKSQLQIIPNLFSWENPNSMFGGVVDSVDVLIPILKILLKKNPDTFVTLHLTSLEDNGYSLVRLMCAPSYMELFDWFAEIVPEFTEEQCVVFKGFVEKQLEKCLWEIITYNNVKMLSRVVSWIKDTCTVSAISKFLINTNPIVYFTTIIENDTYDFADNTINKIEIVHLVFDLYRWAFDGQIPQDEAFLVAIQSIKRSSIRNAFETTFLSK